jgi:hypothetical protein
MVLKYLTQVLLIGGLFLLSSIHQSKAQQVTFADAFVFKISEQIISLNDLSHQIKTLKTLECYYPKSLLTQVFKQLIKDGEDSTLYKIQDYTKVDYSKAQKDFFQSSILFYKLKIYSESHKTQVPRELTRAFYMASRQLNCGVNIFDEGQEFTKEFYEVMKLELFLRTRYLPDENTSKKTKQDIDESIASINNFIGSIDKQISEETYW